MTMSIDVAWDALADPSLPLPTYQTGGAAGADICANFPTDEREGIVLQPNARALVPTGLRMAIPAGYEAQIRPRSGLALKHGVSMVNAPGTIDSDYRGPVGIILINFGDAPFHVAHGARIAQMIVAPVIQVSFNEVSSLEKTTRGGAGFGSTGTSA